VKYRYLYKNKNVINKYTYIYKQKQLQK